MKAIIRELSGAQKREALEHALHSRTFARADQLKRFLRFICEAEAAGETERLTETAIGVEALGRAKGFNPLDDSTVRTRAYELRHRLEKLYALEAPEREVRIVLPKGSYAPSFEIHVVAEAPPAAARRSRWQPWAIVGAVVAAALLFWLFRGNGVDPLVAEAWAPFKGEDALLCVATPLHLTVGPADHRIKGKAYFPAPEEAYPIFRQTRPLEEGAKLGLLFTDNVIGFGTMNAVNATTRRLQEMGAGYQVFPERVAPAATFRSRNVVLFGAPVDSDAITRALEHAPLTVEIDREVAEFVVRDRRAGRSLVPKKDAQGEFTEVYGLITVLNNRRSERGRLGMVVFSGITSTGTQGAAEYFTTPASLKELKARLEKDGVRGFPAAYQVVVKCRFGNRLLLGYEWLEHRILER